MIGILNCTQPSVFLFIYLFIFFFFVVVFFFFFFFFFLFSGKTLFQIFFSLGKYLLIVFLFLITKTYLYNFDSLKLHFYIVKLGFTGVYIIFLMSAQKHRLWVLVRTASSGRF